MFSRSNIQYGRIDATDEEIFEAAKAADIHDRILSFPDGYDTGMRRSNASAIKISVLRNDIRSGRRAWLKAQWRRKTTSSDCSDSVEIP